MAPQNNLPLQLTSFVGRAREIGEVKRLLGGSRLLTLTGSGGVGKSRLALHVATDLLETYPDGVWWTELAPIQDPVLVPRTVATALGVPKRPGRDTSETLAEFLRLKRLLLIMDNCEHLTVACASLVDALLRRCPSLRIMVTSRESLGSAGELSYRVPPLSLPDLRRLPAARQLLDYEAVRLFVERAALSDARFEITSNNAAAVAQICARLDGIPLALELAAARVKVLAVEQIASRLDDRFRLLTGGVRGSLPRQQTLRATLDWSYALLSEKERLLLARLSVFAGGWTLEAAETVCAAHGVETSEVLNLLTQLVDKSLVAMETRVAEARYRLLETVREYARDRLRESGGEAQALRSHRDFFLALAEQAAPHLFGVDAGAWLDRLEGDLDNLRAAFAWSFTAGEVEHAAREAVALTRLWYFRGYFQEGWESLARVLSRRAECEPLTQARVLTGTGALAFARGDHAEAIALSEEALVLFKRVGDAEGVALCTYRLGNACDLVGDFKRAAECFDESMRLSRELGDEVLYGEALSQRGRAEVRCGNYRVAARILEEALVRRRTAGYRRGIAITLRSLGLLELHQGRVEAAQKFVDESVAVSRAIGDKEVLSFALGALASIQRRAGDLEGSSASYRESLMLAQDIGMKWPMIDALYGLGAICAVRKRPEQGARLFGAAAKLCETSPYALAYADRLDYDGVAAAVRRSLGETQYQEATSAGRALPLERAVEEVLATIPDVIPPAEQATTTGQAEPSRLLAAHRRRMLLTSREQEVAALVAQGLSNREIASRLVISEKTVDAHVQNILNKLGARSRTQIALWSAGHDQTMSSPP